MAGLVSSLLAGMLTINDWIWLCSVCFFQPFLDTDEFVSVWLIIILLITGTGNGILMITCVAVSISSPPPQQLSVGSGIFSMVRNVSGALGISMGIDAGVPLEFYVDDESDFIGIAKYNGISCKLCNSTQELSYFKSSLLCKQCINEMKGNVGVSSIPAPVGVVPAKLTPPAK